MKPNTNSINWFEISVSDIHRAKKFYESIFEMEMTEVMDMMGMQMSFFPSETNDGKAHGGICQSEMNTPSADGVKIYLNAEPDLTSVLDRIPEAGGQIVMPKTNIGEDFGYMAFFVDPEGNVIGLHSNA